MLLVTTAVLLPVVPHSSPATLPSPASTTAPLGAPLGAPCCEQDAPVPAPRLAPLVQPAAVPGTLPAPAPLCRNGSGHLIILHLPEAEARARPARRAQGHAARLVKAATFAGVWELPRQRRALRPAGLRSHVSSDQIKINDRPRSVAPEHVELVREVRRPGASAQPSSVGLGW